MTDNHIDSLSAMIERDNAMLDKLLLELQNDANMDVLMDMIRQSDESISKLLAEIESEHSEHYKKVNKS